MKKFLLIFLWCVFEIKFFNVIYEMYTVFDMSGVIYMAGWIEWINEMKCECLVGMIPTVHTVNLYTSGAKITRLFETCKE